MELDGNFWSTIKDRLKLLNKDNIMMLTMIEGIRYIETAGTPDRPKMILGVPSVMHQYFIIENFMDKIYQEISSFIGSSFEVDITISNQQDSVPDVRKSLISNTNFETTTPYSQKTPSLQSPMLIHRDIMNPDYTFGTFVVGRNTEFAHAASYNVAQNPGAEGYNPLFICGPSGMGKTHLLHAVGNHIRQSFPHLRINYVSAERFLNECVSAIRRHEMEKFRNKYRDNHDVLLVDDVQMIGKTEAVQEEFFHTINSFLERRKQIVVASDRMPKDILGLDDRNRSRLEWGLIADITMPDIETRVAILRYKSERMGLRLSEDVVNHIARISKRSIRELEGNLKKVKMFSELQGLSIDLELAKRVLATHDTQGTISVEDIQKMVADHFKVKVIDLKSTTRAKQIVVPRQVAMYLIKRHLDKSLVDIGRAFGGKDHTTVMNALDRVELLQDKDKDFKNDLEELTTRIHNVTGL